MTTTVPAAAAAAGTVQIISTPIKLSSPNSEGIVDNLESQGGVLRLDGASIA